MEHLPQALLAGAISTTVAGIFVSTVGAIRERRMRHRIEAAQDDIRQQMADGTIRWSIPQDSTVAVIGNGDPFVRNLARKYPDQVLPVSYTATDGAWTHLPKEADHAQTLQALDRADLEHAGQLMVFPITPSQEFLPGPDDYDISVERVVYYIQTSDEFCDRKGIPRKPVMVIGHGEQAECYQTASYSNDNALAEELCLEQRLQQLSEERGCEVILVDPNEIVMDKIVQIADGRKPVLAGTAASVKQYAERFFGALYGRIDVTGDTDPVRVLYNKNDIATVTLARQGDITVVLDPRERPALEWKGIPPEHIVVPAEEVLGVVAPTLEELQELRARSRSV
ncbi:MAG TPA: hypothetical protein VK983_01690 [Candidatus Limnocylindrales bacterium]|nr:hypothetical protein [Candidatus Limnocylindrales bacterium]